MGLLAAAPRVQAGAFREAPRAEAFRADLAAAGFPAEAEREDGLVRVRLAGFASEREAIAARDRVAAYLFARYPAGEVSRPWLVREETPRRSSSAPAAPAPSPRDFPPASGAAAQALAIARAEVGAPYRFGGRADPILHGGLRAFDCSGFTSWVYERIGVAIPRTAADQFAHGAAVEMADLAAGDLVFFETYRPGPSHVGIYLGDGRFVHASSGAGRVVTTSLQDRYYAGRYLGARRVLPAAVAPGGGARTRGESVDLGELLP